MKISNLAATVLVFAAIGHANAGEKPVEPPKERPAETLDARISNLQSSKDCIKNANSREAVQACRGGIKIRQSKDASAPAD